MEAARLSTKGRPVIPNELRKAHRLVVATEFVASFVGDEIRLASLLIALDINMLARPAIYTAPPTVVLELVMPCTLP